MVRAAHRDQDRDRVPELQHLRSRRRPGRAPRRAGVRPVRPHRHRRALPGPGHGTRDPAPDRPPRPPQSPPRHRPPHPPRRPGSTTCASSRPPTPPNWPNDCATTSSATSTTTTSTTDQHDRGRARPPGRRRAGGRAGRVRSTCSTTTGSSPANSPSPTTSNPPNPPNPPNPLRRRGAGIVTIDRLQAHYGFTRTPFRRDLAPQMLHRHTSHGEAVARIGWCVTERALGVITGEVGAGKTVARPRRARRAGPIPAHHHLPAQPRRRGPRALPPASSPRWAAHHASTRPR